MSDTIEIKKGNALGYKVVIVVLAAIIAVLLWLLFTSKQLVTEANDQKEEIRMILSANSIVL